MENGIKKNLLPANGTHWKKWYVPLEEENATIRECLATQAPVAAGSADIPLIVRLIENPKFDIPGINLFNGAVSLEDHDVIHLLLGRGMLPKDEAFVIGFTMGSSNRMSTAEKKMYAFAAKYLYPGPYKFSDDDITVFKKAAHLGYVSDCQPLDTINCAELMDLSLKEARQRVGIEPDLLAAYYQIESQRFSQFEECLRITPQGREKLEAQINAEKLAG
ncbi:hypothetical protein L4D04_04770 [Photobacterium angustum]|uniref:Uncharacterized protein n=1 Tax=Photobacterium angustum (strain S14 / CCUG 15956) TaxID=314292 RepID=Q1ZTY5_PHOAS|nr:hypothetical protein [Photobacterium angustum]EAS66625.1 hypothetical protein VAS14_14949 [Photobacterium angustum S14]KJG06880.1 hypothetical protein UB33_06365 [Photobacterium angustum]PSV94972.1 hypothetical protein CTN01_05135 [Photobacterium angustum]